MVLPTEINLMKNILSEVYKVCIYVIHMYSLCTYLPNQIIWNKS